MKFIAQPFAPLALLALLASVALAGCGDDEESPKVGTVRVTLQDAPFNAESVEVTIAEVAVHFVAKGGAEQPADEDGAAGGEEGGMTTGWYRVGANNLTYDLLELEGAPTELGELEFGEGKITQIRMILAETPAPSITIDGTAHEMEVPSGKVKIVGNFDVVPGREIAIRLDFDAEASVKQKGNGGYTLQPTVKILRD